MSLSKMEFDDRIAEALRDVRDDGAYDRQRAIVQVAGIVSECRRAAGLDQAELAGRLGTQRSAISRLESFDSESLPNIGTLIDIAHACDCRIVLGGVSQTGDASPRSQSRRHMSISRGDGRGADVDDTIAETLRDVPGRTAYERQRGVVEVARMVHDWRISAGLTQAALARLVGTRQSAISRLESYDNANLPNLDTLIGIANACNRQLVLGLTCQQGDELRRIEVMPGTMFEGVSNHRQDAADRYGALAWVHQNRGEIDEAERMLLKALALNEELGHDGWRAVQYDSLGVLYQVRGELERARTMHAKALEIARSLGHEERLAGVYANLGILHQSLGDFGCAREMHRKSLALYESLCQFEDVAGEYGNLGTVHQSLGELDEAEAMYDKACALYRACSHEEGVAISCGNLGIVHHARGDFEQAERMYEMAIAIDEQLGRQEGLGSGHANLGLLYQARGELQQARAAFDRALEIKIALGDDEGIANLRRHLVELDRPRGTLDSTVAVRLISPVLKGKTMTTVAFPSKGRFVLMPHSSGESDVSAGERLSGNGLLEL